MSDEATQTGAGDEAELAGMFDEHEPPENTEQQSTDEVSADDLEVEETEGEQEESEDPEIELKVDGEIKKVKLSQLKANAQKYEAADKRLQEAAAIRKDAEALKSQLPEQERQLKQVLDHYVRETQAIMQAQQPNWDHLLATDPQQYLVVRHQWEQQQIQLQQARQAQQLIEQRESEAKAVSNQGRVKEELTKLQDAIPAWKDPSKAAEGAKAIDTYLAAQGIPAEIRGNIDDHKLVLIAHKAMLYDQALARKQQAQTGVKQAPRVERPGASSQAVPKSQLAKANAAKAFKADPSVNTLASFFE